MSPLVQNYDIYCDETFLHGQIAFAFGALICTPRRADILREKLALIRSNFNHFRELKWSELSPMKLPVYRSFIDAFFDDKYPKFSVMRVIKGPRWNAWGGSEEERFFKSYYVFLKLNAGPFSRYFIYPDVRSLQKGYRWETMHFLFNQSRRGDWDLRRKNIRLLQPLDSDREDLLQLTDMLLGCFTSNSAATAKTQLREHVEARYSNSTTKRRIKTMDWSPQINR